MAATCTTLDIASSVKPRGRWLRAGRVIRARSPVRAGRSSTSAHSPGSLSALAYRARTRPRMPSSSIARPSLSLCRARVDPSCPPFESRSLTLRTSQDSARARRQLSAREPPPDRAPNGQHICVFWHVIGYISCWYRRGKSVLRSGGEGQASGAGARPVRPENQFLCAARSRFFGWNGRLRSSPERKNVFLHLMTPSMGTAP